MKKFILIFILIFSLTGNAVFGEEPDTELMSTDQIYTFPEIEPEVSISTGYRIVDVSDSERAEEYNYLRDTISVATELRLFLFPHRLYLDFDMKNKKDYFGDISYAYHDIVVFRGINRSLFHNLENIDLDPTLSASGVDVRDRDRTYGSETDLSTVFLRLKTPDFPLHVYADARLVKRDGTMQQMTLLGSGTFSNIVRTSQKRDIDWDTEQYTVGINSHLGPIEVDYSHGEKKFDHTGGDKVLYDTYDSPLFGPAVFPHNQISELKSSSNTIKLHTSYTGKIVATTTFSTTESENEDSDAKVDYFMGSGSLVWMPATRLTFFAKYRHRESDFDNPDSVTISDLNNPANTYGDSSVRNSISSRTDTVSVTARLRPSSKLTLGANYTYEEHERSEADEWDLRDSTEKNSYSFSAGLQMTRNSKLKAKYTRDEVANPAYNTDPDHSTETDISFSWFPLSRVNAFLSYTLTKEKRDDLVFTDSTGTVSSPEGRNAKSNKVFGSVTFLILKKLSLTTSYAYMDNKIEQPVFYFDTSGNSLFDAGVPYKDEAQNYLINLNYMLNDRLNLDGGVSYTRSKGEFYPNDSDLLQPESVASFSELEIRETVYSISGDYEFFRGFRLGVDYKYSDFDDVVDSEYDDVEDGSAQTIWVTLSKRWG